MLNPFNVLDISTNKIYTKYKSIITIDKHIYTPDKIFIEKSDHYIVPGILDIFIPELNDTCHLIINYNIKLNKPKNLISENDNELIYDAKELIIYQDLIDTNLNIDLIINLLEGRVKYITEPSVILHMLHDQLPSIDLVHLELIISNMFRSADNLKTKCRYTGNYKNSTILGQWEQPFNDSWLSSLAFERVNKAIHTGLVHDDTIQYNPIENIILHHDEE